MIQNPFPKYIKVNGISKLNPDWKRWQNQNGMTSSLTKKEEENALPVYCSREEYLYNNPQASTLPDMGLSESYQASCDIMQDDDVVAKVGIGKEQIVNVVGELFSKYEIPMGLVNKILELQTFDYIYFVVDDSGSMNNQTDTRNPQTGMPITRWEETRSRLLQLMELLSFIPTQTIIISFLNRNIQLELIHQNGQHPDTFFRSSCDKINNAFAQRPGTTPYAAKIQQVFSQFIGKKVSWYFYGDGVPDGGSAGIRQIENTVLHRQNPQQNPVTFFSCTGEDSEVEWMKNLEEVAPYCSEFDDYQDEKDEVLLDQGLGLPFTKGFYMIGCLVAAINPNDLDAMDESVPFTKYALDNLLGYTFSQQDYQHYFDLFIQAQRARKVEDRADQIKKSFDWRPMYGQFIQCNLSMEIQGVQEFKRQLHIASGKGYQQQSYAPPAQGYAQSYAPPNQGYAQSYAPPSQGYAQSYAPPPGPPPNQHPQFPGTNVYAPNSQGSNQVNYSKRQKKDCIIQ